MENKIVTTIKIDLNLYDQFKVLGVRYKLKLQGLVDKCIFKYVTDDTFRNDINNFSNPVLMNGSTPSSASILTPI